MKPTYIGIDIAKDDFVAARRIADSKPSIFLNTSKGINKFVKSLPDDSWYIMEATRVYSVRLATQLYEQGIKVSVINPLQIKRFAQTKLKRTKTDFVSAHLIAEYGDIMKPEPFTPIPEFIHQLQQKRALIRQLVKSRTALKNQLKSFRQLPDPDKLTITSYDVCLRRVATMNNTLGL